MKEEDEPLAESSKKGKKRGRKSKQEKSKKSKKTEESDDEEVEKEYEVEKIIEVHHKKSGDREFLVRWKGYSKKDDTWEPEKNLNCQDLIDAFLKKVSKVSVMLNVESLYLFGFENELRSVM